MLKSARFFVFLISILSSLLLVSYLFFAKNTHAAGEFETDYQVSYTIDTSGQTAVNQQITLRNKTENFYADKFELKIGSTKVDNVKAQDEVGPMETNVKFEDNVTTISVKFNQKVIGLDKTQPWTLTYSSGDLATKSGQIWEVSIPRLAKGEEIVKYEASVFVPTSFGPVAFALPTPLSQNRQRSQNIFTFNKNQLQESGISMSFGEKQVFQFTLSYFIENQNITSRVEEITLPPDNNYQKVVLNSIEPMPADVSVDADGNFIAKYKLSPKQKVNVTASGYVEVFEKPFRNIYKDLSAEEKNRYLEPQRYWETDAAVIKEKAKELKSPKEIYDFVATYLSYSDERLNSPKIERKGALSAINTPKEAVCMEFTDLFIAIARAGGIPAKEVLGYAYTQNARLRPLSLLSQGDLLHAWPEYWDPKLGWVQVDPTWGATSGGLDYFNKLDFNHITLSERGGSSTFPYPAGAYKEEGQQSKKDVLISFAQDLPQITSAADIELEVDSKVIAGIPIRVVSKVKNTGSASILGGKLLLESPLLQVTSENPVDFAILPPYSKKTVMHSLQGRSLLSKTNSTLTLSFNDIQITKPIQIVPFYFLLVSPTFVGSLILATLIIIIGLFLYRRIHKKRIPTGVNLG